MWRAYPDGRCSVNVVAPPAVLLRRDSRHILVPRLGELRVPLLQKDVVVMMVLQLKVLPNAALQQLDLLRVDLLYICRISEKIPVVNLLFVVVLVSDVLGVQTLAMDVLPVAVRAVAVLLTDVLIMKVLLTNLLLVDLLLTDLLLRNSVPPTNMLLMLMRDLLLQILYRLVLF